MIPFPFHPMLRLRAAFDTAFAAIVLVLLAVGLAGCGAAGQPVRSAATVAATAADAAGAPKPRPLATTAIDEKALVIAARALDTLAVTASRLVNAGAIQPGSATALKLADGMDKARHAINAAAAAREVLDAESYRRALADAEGALGEIRQALGD